MRLVGRRHRTHHANCSDVNAGQSEVGGQAKTLMPHPGRKSRPRRAIPCLGPAAPREEAADQIFCATPLFLVYKEGGGAGCCAASTGQHADNHYLVESEQEFRLYELAAAGRLVAFVAWRPLSDEENDRGGDEKGVSEGCTARRERARRWREA